MIDQLKEENRDTIYEGFKVKPGQKGRSKVFKGRFTDFLAWWKIEKESYSSSGHRLKLYTKKDGELRANE